MVFFYPVYSDNTKSEVLYVYTGKTPSSIKNKNFSNRFYKQLKQKYGNTLRYSPGMCFDSKTKELLVSTSINIGEYKQKGDKKNSTKYALLDGTTISLYRLNGEIKMGTINSWDITNIRDITDKTYGDYFLETCREVQWDIPEIKEGSGIILTFTNPNIHFMSQNYSVLVYNHMELITLEGIEEPELAKDGKDFFTFHNNCIFISQSENRENVCSVIYSNRKRFRGDNYKQRMFSAWYGLDTFNLISEYLAKDIKTEYLEFVNKLN